ncbi:hypothetical protein EBS02_05035, partial [bacterium]|nr:hypothetical protein [bacterium]
MIYFSIKIKVIGFIFAFVRILNLALFGAENAQLYAKPIILKQFLMNLVIFMFSSIFKKLAGVSEAAKQRRKKRHTDFVIEEDD